MNYDTTKLLLGIDDKHVKIKGGTERADGVIQVTGKLTYRPKACVHCGVINDHTRLSTMVGGKRMSALSKPLVIMCC
ncbi:transposase [Secundilactobacillus pentosiphilus]|uniref:Transposase n=1 Tax=Secundilactobacillus pentosiphilus TaxID=1714682 RepID=A0A1Z5IMJ3_9LACO|nr:transposase [Secundilactobacillus pentosiphilus]